MKVLYKHISRKHISSPEHEISSQASNITDTLVEIVEASNDEDILVEIEESSNNVDILVEIEESSNADKLCNDNSSFIESLDEYIDLNEISYILRLKLPIALLLLSMRQQILLLTEKQYTTIHDTLNNDLPSVVYSEKKNPYSHYLVMSCLLNE